MDHQSTSLLLQEDLPNYFDTLKSNVEQASSLDSVVEEAYETGQEYLSNEVQLEAFERTKLAKAEVMTCILTGQSYVRMVNNLEQSVQFSQQDLQASEVEATAVNDNTVAILDQISAYLVETAASQTRELKRRSQRFLDQIDKLRQQIVEAE